MTTEAIESSRSNLENNDTLLILEVERANLLRRAERLTLEAGRYDAAIRVLTSNGDGTTSVTFPTPKTNGTNGSNGNDHTNGNGHSNAKRIGDLMASAKPVTINGSTQITASVPVRRKYRRNTAVSAALTATRSANKALANGRKVNGHTARHNGNGWVSCAEIIGSTLRRFGKPVSSGALIEAITKAHPERNTASFLTELSKMVTGGKVAKVIDGTTRRYSLANGR